MRFANFFLLFSILLVSCSDNIEFPNTVVDDPMDPVIDTTPIIDLNLYPITGFDDGHFIDSNGKEIFPWGYNYTNADQVGLIEDNWEIVGDFQEMKEYSANIVRIHLQYNKFMLDVNTPNQANLDILLDLVEMAEKERLYLDITGLAAYRKSDSPEWYDALTDQERWDTHKIFWQSIAKTVGDNPAVFAYNLMNEPVVSVGCDVIDECDWLPGQSFGGFNFVENISRDPGKVYNETISDWADQMTEAIRSEDPNTMITIGFLSLGDIKQFETDLDYVSSHIYPKSAELDEAVAFIEANQTAPLIIEETGNLHCNIDELAAFLDDIDGKYHGLLGHYHGKTLEEMGWFDIVDALRTNFINMMIERNPN